MSSTTKVLEQSVCVNSNWYQGLPPRSHAVWRLISNNLKHCCANSLRLQGHTVLSVNPQFLQSMQILSMQRKKFQAFWDDTLYPTGKQLPTLQKRALLTKLTFFDCLTLKMDALCYSETLTVFQTGVYIPEHLNFHQHRCVKLKIGK
jgi:hypothetical protein